MISTFFGIETARQGLQAHRRSMEVTGHNIANANTPGYSRQEAVHRASDPYTVPALHRVITPGQLGSGVSVDQIRRIRNEYLDAQFRDNAANEGFWRAKLDVAQQVELTFPEPLGRGIQSVMLNFYNDWHELNNNPQDAGVKAAVRESGLELASLIRQTHSQLNHVMDSVAVVGESGYVEKGRVYDQVEQINAMVSEINELTTAIERIKALGNQPNDLMDRRDVLLDKLSAYGELEIIEHRQGTVSLKLFDQDLLIADNEPGDRQQFVKAKLEDGTITIMFGTYDNEGNFMQKEDDDENPIQVDGLQAYNGSLAGLQVSLVDLDRYIDKLNTLAETLIEKVNDAHETVFFTGDSAENIFVDFSIITSLYSINGDKALKVAQLRSTPLIEGGTLEGYYQGLVSEVGAKTRNALDQLTNQLTIREQVESLRESAAGVSLDEELSRMIQFQYGFQASARMMAALDDMLDIIINRLFR